MSGVIPDLSNTLARRVFLHRHGLLDRPPRTQSKAGLLGLVERLGFIQVDSINTVERAHHMIVLARQPAHRSETLATLLEQDRSLFENWTHDAAVIPTALFPIWRRHFVRVADRLRERWRSWRREGFEAEFDAVLARIARDGPVLARELSDGTRKGGGGWWDWHPSKTALEYLWRTGALAVTRRDGFQKVYDLTERVIPAVHRESEIDDPTLVDWACRSALARLGFATPGELAGFWGLIGVEEAKAWCEAVGRIDYATVTVGTADGSKPRLALADPTLLALDAENLTPPARLRVLSPFDPVIRDRKRTQRLFGFDYRIEVFVPAVKRRYGYYVFPLLDGDRLVGRIDMRCRRDDGVLVVTGLWWELGLRPTKARQGRLEAELDRIARFTDCTQVQFECDR